MTACSTVLSFFSEYKVSVLEIERRLQEDPECNSGYFVTSLRERGIKIEANGTNLISTPDTSTKDLNLCFNQVGTSGYAPPAPYLAEELSYSDPKESNMESATRLKESVNDLESQAHNNDEKREVNENKSAE